MYLDLFISPPQKGPNMKHSIVLFLSTFATTQNPNGEDNLRHTKYKNIEEASVDPKNPVVDCVQTNESAVRFLQAKLAKQGERIDKIYIIASKGVKEEKDFVYQGKQMRVSHMELFKKRLEDTIGIQADQYEYINYNEDETVDTNMKALLALADELRKKDGDQDKAKVHFDMTGGLRTVTQMMTSLLYLLKHSKVNIGNVLYSDFTKNTVDDMSELFDINTLVAGIEEFTNYGSTRSLQAYFKTDHTDVTTMSESCYQLIEAMKAFSIAVSLCIPYEMVKAIKVLKEAIETFKAAPALSVKEETFKYTIHTVEQEYASLLTYTDQELTLKLKIIRWCLDKSLLQQALTLSTEWLPTILFDEKIYYHPNLEKLRSSLEGNTRKLKRTLKEEFIMSYRKNAPLLESASLEAYNERPGVRTLADSIQFLRQNIAEVQKKKDLDTLLSGLRMKGNKLYELVYCSITAKDSLSKMVVKNAVKTSGSVKKVKDLSYIKNIDDFQGQHSLVDTYLKRAYGKLSQNQENYPSYSRFLYQQSQNLGKLLNCIVSSFSNVELIDEFSLSLNDEKVPVEKEDDLIQKKDDMAEVFYHMLKNKFAYTDLPLEEGLRFIVEYHSIRKLRNTINHASEEQQIISSKDIISKIENLIEAIEKKEWKKVTVMNELKEIIDISKETVGKSNK